MVPNAVEHHILCSVNIDTAKIYITNVIIIIRCDRYIYNYIVVIIYITERLPQKPARAQKIRML